MNEIPLGILAGVLILLILLSAFFSGSETGIVSLNRYRLRHLDKEGHKGAQRASRLLERPDRLIGLILLGNNFVNILASSIATIIGIRLLGEVGVPVAAALLTLVILIFAEVAPKTLAVLHPERIAFPAAFLLEQLLKILYPVVWTVNTITNGLLKLIGVSPTHEVQQSISSEELRILVSEAGSLIPQRHQKMLTNILDLEKVSVNDIMIPRNEIIGIDLDQDWDTIVKQLRHGRHTRLPVYRSDINNVIGLIHIRNIIDILSNAESSKTDLKPFIRSTYFVPENTPLNTQLIHFQRQKRRIGLVVDEYGDVQGLVTLEDILEEIVGQFTSDPANMVKDIHAQEDGTFLIDGSATIRDLNRMMKWHLPTSGPKTFNGLILEKMEHIPEPGTSILIEGYPIEILQIKDNAVKVAKFNPKRITVDENV